MDTEKPKRKFNAQRLGWTLLVLFIAVNIAYTTYLRREQAKLGGPNGPVSIALSVGSQDPYWDAVIQGAELAAKDHNVELVVHKPENLDDQNVFLRKTLVRNSAQGIALSPVNADTQSDLINSLAAAIDVVTIDSDAPTTRRQFYIGTHNYEAGRQLGRLIKEALPDGGKVVISVGSLAKVNGQQRRQGLIDELLGAERDRDRPLYPVDETQSGADFTVVTYSDGTDPEKAKQNAIDAFKDHPDIRCIAGLYGYSVPQALAGLEETGNLSQVELVGFDVHPATLAGIRDGNVYATLVQKSEQFGYDSVWVLATMARNENPPISESRLHGCTVIKAGDLSTPVAESTIPAP